MEEASNSYHESFMQLQQQVVEMGGLLQQLLEASKAPRSQATPEGATVPRPESSVPTEGSHLSTQDAEMPTRGNRHPHLKLMKPNVYTGSTQAGAVKNFLFDCDQNFRGMEIDSHDKRILFAVSLLGGVAKSWWRFHVIQIDKKQVPDIFTWETFKEVLLKRFCVVNATHTARGKLDALKQVGSVRSYISTFQNLLMQIPNIQDEESLHRFTQGLQFRIKKEVALREPQGLDAAIQLAEKYNALLHVVGNQPNYRAPLINDTPRPRLGMMPAVVDQQGPVPIEVDAFQRRQLTKED